MPIIIDAGPLYAAADVDDAHHEQCAAFLNDHPGPFVVPQLVVAEVAYLIAKRLDARTELLFLSELSSGGLSSEPVEPGDWLRIMELVKQYEGFPLGTVDASVITCAERLGIASVATLDYRHFGAIRPRHVDAFDLVPLR
jgi:uncharacterized protein